MLNSVTVTNFRDDSVDIELFHPEKSGFLITSIDGISFSEADINTMDVATIDGSQYVSSKMKSRSITMNLVFVGEDSVETLRHKCYKYFPSKKKVRLQFNTDTRSAWIEGYVESNKTEIFSENESTAITIICPDPFLRVDNEQAIIRGEIDPLFEFPFSNESLDEKLIEFGSIGINVEKTIAYSGESDTAGILISLEFLSWFSGDIAIYNTTTYDYGDNTGFMKLSASKIKSLTNNKYDTRTSSIVGCRIEISSVIGNKYIKLISPTLTEEYNILGALDRDVSSWLYLVPGDNVFVFNATYESVVMTITYDTLYGGV